MIPFIILIFYILGGGSAPARAKEEVKPTTGKVAVNYSLPEADRTIGIVDKMEAVQSQTQSYGTQDYHIGADNNSAVITFGKDSTSVDDEAQDQEGENHSGRSDRPNLMVSATQVLGHVRRRHRSD